MSASTLFSERSPVDIDHLSSDWPVEHSNDPTYSHDVSESVTSSYRLASATLSPTTLAFTLPDSLSTGAPKMAAGWWTCCQCKQMVNPNLAPEQRCPCCSHTRCTYCRSENVQ